MSYNIITIKNQLFSFNLSLWMIFKSKKLGISHIKNLKKKAPTKVEAKKHYAL